MAKVSIVKSGKSLKSSVKKSVSLIGGFKKIVNKGDSILIKPNYNSDDPFPASTDTEFLRAVIELLKEAGASKISLGESSGPFWKPTMKVLKKMGVLQVCEELDVDVLDFDNMEHEYKKNHPKAKHLKGANIPKGFYDFDKLIYLPCLKTHSWARFTLSLKLAMGIPKTSDRLKMHVKIRKDDLENKVAELNLLVKPDLVIMDGRKCFVTGGPDKGEVKEPGVILASEDQVAIDIEGVKIIQNYKAKNKLGMPVLELPLIKRSIEIGIGKPGHVVKN